MKRALLLSLFLSACGVEYHPPTAEQEEQAVALIWLQEMGMWEYEPPHIHYVATNCHSEDGAPGIWEGIAGRCVGGYHPYKGHEVYVHWYSKYWYSAFAHELLHERLEVLTGDADGNHTRPEWRNVEVWDTKLKAAGL